MPTTEKIDPTTGEITQVEIPPVEIKQETAGNVVPTSGGMPALTPEQLAMMEKDSGKQKFEIRELMIPVLKIANTTSGVMKKSDSEYRKEAEEGDLYDSLTFTFYKPPLTIIVIRFETNYIESKPKLGPTVKLWGTDRTGYDRAVGKDVGARMTKDGNEIREVGTYYCLVLLPDGRTLPAIMYLGSTSWREARRLNALLGSMELMGPNGPFVAPPYARYYTVTTVPANDGAGNTWMTWKFDPGSMVLASDRGVHYYQRCRQIEEAIDKKLTRVVGTADEDMHRDAQQAAQRASGGGGAPPQDNVPPPSGEADYGSSGQSQGDRQEAVVEKAKSAPF